MKFGRPPLPLPENFYEVHCRWRNKELTLFYSGEYGSATVKRTQTYQYYKENDTWSACGSGDYEVVDVQWNLEKLLDGKTYTGTYDDGSGYTVTLSDLDLSAMTVTATYSYTPPESKQYQYNCEMYCVKNLKGERVDRLSGTVKCHIEEVEEYGEMRGYYIEEPVGSLWLSKTGYDFDYDKLKDVEVYFRFYDPITGYSDVSVRSIAWYER